MRQPATVSTECPGATSMNGEGVVTAPTVNKDAVMHRATSR